MHDLPAAAAWRHLDTRVGFEVVLPRREGGGYRLQGHSTAVEEGDAWGVTYEISVDERWVTRSAHVVCASASGTRELRIAGDGAGSWALDGSPAPELAGCLDVDLEASACTNVLPVRRLALPVGGSAEAPAVYVRATTLEVERLEQGYTRVEDANGQARYDYASPRFDYAARLVFDAAGLVLEYPGLAVRVA